MNIEGKTRRKARRLHLQLEALVQALQDRDWPLPEPLLEGAAGTAASGCGRSSRATGG